jgi:hypothetical protein
MAGLMDLLNSLRGGMPNQVGAQSLLAPKPMPMPQMMPQQLPQQLSAPVGVNGQVPMMKNGQTASISPMMIMPQTMPDMGAITPQTAPIQPMQPQGLRGMLGLDKPTGGGNSGFNRGEAMALALSQIGNMYGPNQGRGENVMGQAIMQQVGERQKEQKAMTQRDQLVAQMKAAGSSPQDIIAVQLAPETAVKAILERSAPYTLNQGDARFGPGGQLVANNPKFAYQNDQVLQEGPGGITNMGRLNPSFENIETERNNRQQNAIGWQNANTSARNSGSQWRAMTPEEVAQKGLAPGTAAQINSVTGKYEVAPQGSKSGQLTEQEAKFGLYAGQALQAASELDALEVAGYNRAGWGEMETSAFSDEAKIYDNKITQFIDAWARAMTGAAMTKVEADSYKKQLSPQAFDTPEVRDQKSAMRRQMGEQLRIAAGRGMKIADQTQIDTPQPGSGQQPPMPLVDTNGRIIRE